MHVSCPLPCPCLLTESIRLNEQAFSPQGDMFSQKQFSQLPSCSHGLRRVAGSIDHKNNPVSCCSDCTCDFGPSSSSRQFLFMCMQSIGSCHHATFTEAPDDTHDATPRSPSIRSPRRGTSNISSAGAQRPAFEQLLSPTRMQVMSPAGKRVIVHAYDVGTSGSDSQVTSCSRAAEMFVAAVVLPNILRRWAYPSQ